MPSPYFVLLTVGLALGCLFLLWRGERQGVQRIVLVDVCLAAVFGGLAGGRLLHVLVEPLPADPVVLDAGEREHLLAIRAAQPEGAARDAVDAALQAEAVPEGWTFVAHMPPGRWRDAALVQLGQDPQAVPVRWWYASRPLEIPQFWKGGLAWLGGLLTAIVACVIVVRRHGASVGQLADLAAPSVALGLIFGRLGCFLNGCCYGEVCEPAWYAHSPGWYPDVLRGVPRYPTALLSAAVALLVTVGGLLYGRVQRRAGETALVCLILYAPGRFIIEGLRDDPRGGAGGLSTSQWLALACGVPALLGWVWLRLRGAADPAPEPDLDGAPPAAAPDA